MLACQCSVKLVCALARQCLHCPTGVCVLLACLFTLSYWCVCVCVGLLVFTLPYWCVNVLLACWCSHCPTGVCGVCLSVFTLSDWCECVVVGLSVFTLSCWCVNVLLACQCSHTVLLMCVLACRCLHCPSGVWVCWPVGVHIALLVCECVVGLLVFTLSYWCVWCSPVCSHCPIGVSVLLACQCSHTVLLMCVGLSVFTLSYWCVGVLACQCGSVLQFSNTLCV